VHAYLDIRTLSFVASVIGLLLFACLLYVSRTRKTYPGFGHWTVSAFCYMLGMLLIGLRNTLPAAFTIVLPNGLLIGTLCLLGAGIATFADLKHRLWRYAVPVALSMALSAVFTYHTPSLHTRIAIFSALFALCAFWCAILIHRHIPRFLHSANRLLELSLAVGGLWSVFRGIYTPWFESSHADLLLSSPVQGASLLIYTVTFIALCFGLSVLNSQRVEYDLSRANDEVKVLKGIIPICAACKKIRDDKGYWTQVESYIRSHSEAEFSHGLCPDCVKKLYPELSR